MAPDEIRTAIIDILADIAPDEDLSDLNDAVDFRDPAMPVAIHRLRDKAVGSDETQRDRAVSAWKTGISRAAGLLALVWSAHNWLGSGLIEFQSQYMTMAARAIAERKTFGHLSYRVATRRQSFRRPNIISILLRRL